MGKRIEVYSIPGFLNGEPPKRIDGTTTIPRYVIVTTAAVIAFHDMAPVALATVKAAPVSTAFDHKIWPLFLDIGKPLAKTMIALGIYRCMRNDVDKGWKMIYRAGLGLVGLYLVDGAIHILSSIGDDLVSA
jgi:hypothetical protein